MLSKTLILNLRGGLGNQIFQAFGGAHFANKLGAKLLLDDSGIINHKDYTRRSWLREFSLEGLFPEISMSWRKKPMAQILSRIPRNMELSSSLEEIELIKLDSIKRKIKIHDWFISTKYLPETKSKLLKDYVHNLSPTASNFALAKGSMQDSASIHIRLGDFKQTPWGTLSPEWYRSALLRLAELGVREVDCYSDDLQDAKKMLQGLEAQITIRFPEEHNVLLPHELLFVMSNYRYFVSSNSTLSWWASYFNSRKNSVILSNWGDELHLTGWWKVK
jgi:hypothetical protein